jgi:hypothetical protein
MTRLKTILGDEIESKCKILSTTSTNINDQSVIIHLLQQRLTQSSLVSSLLLRPTREDIMFRGELTIIA